MKSVTRARLASPVQLCSILAALVCTASNLSAGVIAPSFDASVTNAERTVISCAIQYWNSALPDAGLNANPVGVTFRKAGGGLASTIPLTSTDQANNVIGGGVAGDLYAGRPQTARLDYSATAGTFFVDPAPCKGSEATGPNNAGFTAIDTADPNGFDDAPNQRFFRNFSGDAGDAQTKTDLLSVIMHELGHALGFDGDYIKFRAQMTGLFGQNDNGITINTNTFGIISLDGDGQDGAINNDTSPRNAINEISHLFGNGHTDGAPGIYGNSDLMNPQLGVGRRRIISPLDVDILSKAYGYTGNLNPIPEPGTLSLLLVGTLALIRRRRDRAAAALA